MPSTAKATFALKEDASALMPSVHTDEIQAIIFFIYIKNSHQQYPPDFLLLDVVGSTLHDAFYVALTIFHLFSKLCYFLLLCFLIDQDISNQ